MLSSFWSGLGGELAKQWIPRILSPAFAFWMAGVALIWWHAHGADARAHGFVHELNTSVRGFGHLPAVIQGALVIGALAVVAVSALAVERLTLPTLRLLEGYWTRPRALRGWLIRRRRKRRAVWEARLADLRRSQRRGGLSVEQYLELVRLKRDSTADQDRLRHLLSIQRDGFTADDAAELMRGQIVLRRSPGENALAMPTRLGDILRAAERRPYGKYGLDSVICWTALWLVLPTEPKTEITAARSSLDNAVRIWLWGGLFLVWTPWAPWAIGVAIIVPAVSYYWGMLGAATLFGDLTVVAFDLWRMNLYDALHLPRPASPADEVATSRLVNNLLWGGIDSSAPYVTAAEGG